MGLFGKIIGALKKTKDNISSKLNALFAKNKLGDDFYDELEEILISADISVTTAEDIIDQIRAEAKAEKLKDREFVIDLLKDVIEDTLCEAEVPEIEYPAVIMLVGVERSVCGRVRRDLFRKGEKDGRRHRGYGGAAARQGEPDGRAEKDGPRRRARLSRSALL